MLICEYCGQTIEDDELGYHREYLGECWGSPAYETRADECSCGGNFIEADECPVCGEWKTTEQKVCQDCIDKSKTLKNAILTGRRNTEKVEINGFAFAVFSEDELNEILEEAIQERFGNKEFSIHSETYCELHEDDYIDVLVEGE